MIAKKLFSLVVEETKNVYHKMVKNIFVIDSSYIEEDEAINNVVLYFLENNLFNDNREFTDKDVYTIELLVSEYLGENLNMIENRNKSQLEKWQKTTIRVDDMTLGLTSF